MRRVTYRVPQESDGRPMRRVVRGEMGLSQHLYASLKRRNACFVDGQPARANQVVRAGQVIELVIEDAATQVQLVEPEDKTLAVVYEDEDVIIVDKPAPLACMQGVQGDGNSLEARFLWHYRDEGVLFRPVNRLDKGTSGLMALARNPHAQQIMQARLHTNGYVREYMALVEGTGLDDEGVIDRPIGKADGATVRRAVRADGKPAVTRYRKLHEGGGRTLLRLRLETGRTHQIRVHLQSIGHPVVGDFLYGHEVDELPRRFALHSCFLSLQHPLTGARLSFESPLPPEIAALITE